ncbi:FAD-dependent oxidoreductase [Pseudoalteromonas sp. YIC-656]|uniref:L-aspartate oxidase n=1 Tax=Pseudoalteromonas pernae TaxID=3118054 RepID=UPI003241C9BE
MTQLDTEIVIVGAGLAGCTAALEAANAGCKVILLSKILPIHSHSVSARGGMNVAVNEQSAAQHVNDTLKSGAGVENREAVEYMCNHAIETLHWFETLGVHFDKAEDGSYKTKKFGGCSSSRACFVKGRTGLTLMNTLLKHIRKHPQITVIDQIHVSDLVKQNERVVGICGWHKRDGAAVNVYADAVVLATGGGLNVYKETTNAVATTGDGLAMALRAGAALKDMEFVQFHPLGLGHTGIQVPEPVLGAGGYLRNSLGERFMQRYEPQQMELAGRDKVSIAIERELQRLGDDVVYLDLRHIDEEQQFALQEARSLVGTFLGLDIGADLIPVRPSAHYLMGGIACDLDGQAENAQGQIIPGLFAVGEAACSGVHGANRIGGNSLLEVVVYGRRVGRAVCAQRGQSPEIASAYAPTIFVQQSDSAAKTPSEILNQLQLSMSNFAGVIRCEAGLKTHIAFLNQLKITALNLKLTDDSITYNQERASRQELMNMLDVALAISLAAMARTQSLGAHYREDDLTEHHPIKYNTCVYLNDKQLQVMQRVADI